MANNDFKASDFVDGYGGAAGGSTIDATGISTEGALTVDGNTTLGGDLTVDDDGFTIQDNLDNTKKIAFQASGITTATTRTLTAPDQDGTIVTEDGSGDVSITNDLTVNGNTTLVGNLTVDDDGFTIQDNLDNTKKIAFQASGITTATTRTLTAPDQDGTIVTEDGSGDVSITNDLSVGGTQEIGATGYGANAAADELVIGSGAGATAGLTIHTSNSGSPSVYFADIGSNQVGRLIYQHNGNRFEIYANNTLAMEVKETYMLPPTAASAPGSPAEGWIYYDTTLNEPRVYDGTEWRAMEGAGAPAWGEMYTNNLGGTADTVTISVAGTHVKYAAFANEQDDGTLVTADSTTGHDLTIETNGGGEYDVYYGFCVDCASNNQDLDVALFKNGSIISSTERRVRHGNAADLQEITGHALVALADADVIDVRLANATSTANIGVYTANMSIRRAEES